MESEPKKIIRRGFLLFCPLMLVLGSLFLSIRTERLPTSSRLYINLGDMEVCQIERYPDSSNLSCGSNKNGFVIGRNKFGFYGGLFVNSSRYTWGTWYRL